MNEITARKAAALTRQFLQDEGIPYARVTGQTVGFTDLARTSAVFVTIKGWQPDAGNHAKVEKFSQNSGFIAQYEQGR